MLLFKILLTITLMMMMSFSEASVIQADNTYGRKIQRYCPLITKLPEAECKSRRITSSQCWSPGVPDLDCPNNGICCFDGCFNMCGIPNVKAAAPVCNTQMQQVTENVEMDVCDDVPGSTVCWQDNTTECKEECVETTVEEQVVEYEECCQISKELECSEIPCDPNSGHTVMVRKTVTQCTYANTVQFDNERNCSMTPVVLCRRGRDGCNHSPDCTEQQVCETHLQQICVNNNGEDVSSNYVTIGDTSCDASVTTVEQVVLNDCSIPRKQCHFKEQRRCKQIEKPVTKLIPKVVCNDQCQSICLPERCSVLEPKTRKCNRMIKPVTYNVPICKD